MNNLLEQAGQTVINNNTKDSIIKYITDNLFKNSDIYQDSKPNKTLSDIENILKNLGDNNENI